MLLKKQTVWLLTMLSLVVVLSVYYITSPEQKMTELATIEENQNGTDTDVTKNTGEVTSSTTSDEAFEVIRMELEDKRSQRKEDLEKIMASTDLPAEQRNKAVAEYNQLDEITNNEELLETMITAALGYEDALVRFTDTDKILITVKAEKKSAKAANDIMKLVRDEVGSLQYVTVDFKTVQ
jgi:stage III sporulation protein AH